jgi:hypothetical protein
MNFIRRQSGLNHKKGWIALVSLLIINAVALAIAISVNGLSVNDAASALGISKKMEADAIAQGCVEDALIQLRNVQSYSGGTLPVGNGSCAIVISGGGSSRTIDVTATIVGPPNYGTTRRVTAILSGGSIIRLSDQEL